MEADQRRAQIWDVPEGSGVRNLGLSLPTVRVRSLVGPPRSHKHLCSSDEDREDRDGGQLGGCGRNSGSSGGREKWSTWDL